VNLFQLLMRASRAMRRPPTSATSNPGGPEAPDVGFVACIEGGVLEAQALLLFDSIRRYAGRLSRCPLYALSPRAGHAISCRARERLDELEVHFSDLILNTEAPEYGSANRVAAAAHVEETRAHAILVVLDSDTLFLREPAELLLPPDVDVAVRPVDVKGISTAGPDDPGDAYWLELCRCSGVAYDVLPWSESFVDRQRIKANYNGGLVVVRRELGVLRKWADIFFKSIRAGVRPHRFESSFRSGAGWVAPGAARLWGTNQAALSLAIWSSSRRVRELPPTYNYPLHLHDSVDEDVAASCLPRLAHVHYHWLLAADSLQTNPLFLPSGPLSSEQRAWLDAATPID
jgi:hypothetical protein